jgi:hypothetical protein
LVAPVTMMRLPVRLPSRLGDHIVVTVFLLSSRD